MTSLHAKPKQAPSGMPGAIVALYVEEYYKSWIS
jgi:hypothetical protein